MGPADTDNDYDISVPEAYNYVLTKVRDWSIRNNHKQTPTLYTKIAGDVVLVAVPRPAPVSTLGPLTLRRVIIQRKTDRIPYSYVSDYGKARAAAKESCLNSLSNLGASIAEIFGPEAVNATETGDLTRSYRHGRFVATMVSSGEQFDCFLRLEMEPDVSGNQRLFEDLVKNGEFDEVEYEFSVPINLLKAYSVIGSYSMKVVGYDPPRQLTAAGLGQAHVRMNIENTSVDSKIRIRVFSMAGHVNSETAEAVSLAKIMEFVHSTI